MGYFNKKEIVEWVNASCERIAREKFTPITDPQEPLKKLTDEEDLVGFFWLELAPNGENGVGIKMEGKVFVKLESELYTDDRFAIDSYQAAKEGVLVTEIIKRREEEKRNAQNQ
ncbi:MAG TPA: hypothetical protein V6C58_21045, partial [Allocoleopsis sp.]